ncbi:MAG TPA: tetratricopeptide repeat protein, partial [Polyangia bacterium]
MNLANRWCAAAMIISTFSSLLLAEPARADRAPATDDQGRAKAEALEHFEQGVRLGESGSYREAAAEFERAYRLSPHYAVLYNLGQAYMALGQPVEAVEALQRYLTEGASQVPAARRSEVQAAIKQQRARIGSVVLEANVDGAALLVDGVTVGRSPLPSPVRVARGEHQITAVLDGYRATPRTVTVSGDGARVTTVLERVAPAEQGVAPAPPVPTTLAPSRPPAPAPEAPAPAGAPVLAPPVDAGRAGRDASRGRHLAGWILGAAGLALGGVALGHYLWNRSRFESYERAMVDDPAKASSIRSASAVTAGLAITSGVLLATGIVLVV